MFGFFFKKSFFDVWDNLFFVIICNFIFLIVLTLCGVIVCLPSVLDFAEGAKNIMFFFCTVAASVIFFIFVFAQESNIGKISRAEVPRYSDFFFGILRNAKNGALFGLLVGVLYNVSAVGLPFYLNLWNSSRESVSGIMAFVSLVVLFWAVVTTFLSLLWFLPIHAVLGNGFLKTLRKCFIVFLDNPGFTFGMLFVLIVNLAFSVVTIGLLPGVNGMLVTSVDAFRLRLYKYDWIEVNPDLSRAERRNVPWTELLAKERKLLGKRTLKNFFFPWKE